MNQEYAYYAFISYKRENWQWASWMKKNLQSYRLPVKTHKQHPTLPRRFNRVFLDKTNLTPGILEERLRDEVQASKFLNDRGKSTSQMYYGPDGSPAALKDGYAIMSMEHDEYGNTTKISFSDGNGNPVSNLRGYASQQMEYDERGYCVLETYYGPDGSPVTCRNGYAGSAAEYDEYGNLVKYVYLGTDGNPSPLSNGHLGRVMEYDAYGNVTHAEWLYAEGTER